MGSKRGGQTPSDEPRGETAMACGPAHPVHSPPHGWSGARAAPSLLPLSLSRVCVFQAQCSCLPCLYVSQASPWAAEQDTGVLLQGCSPYAQGVLIDVLCVTSCCDVGSFICNAPHFSKPAIAGEEDERHGVGVLGLPCPSTQTVRCR